LANLISGELTNRNAVEQRIIANRVKTAIESWIKSEQSSPFSPTAMTDIEAKRFGFERMRFGKYAGELISSVPLDYLAWLADQCRKTWLDLNGYLRSPTIKAELEVEDER
jgi:hypothetical protein